MSISTSLCCHTLKALHMVLLRFWTWRPSRPASVYGTKLYSDWPRIMGWWQAPGEHRLDTVMRKLGTQGNTVGGAKKMWKALVRKSGQNPIKVKLFLLVWSHHYPQIGKTWDILVPMGLTYHVASPTHLAEHCCQAPQAHPEATRAPLFTTVWL